MKAVVNPLRQGWDGSFIREADEVKVFEISAGTFRYTAANRKPIRKTIGRPIRQTYGGLRQKIYHLLPNVQDVPPVGKVRAMGLVFVALIIIDNFI